jgi:putative transposase
MNKPTVERRRKRLRLETNQYPFVASYFITISCADWTGYFGYVEHRTMHLSEFGKIAHAEWEWIISRFKNVEPDVFQVMPDHFHALIHVNGSINFMAETKLCHDESSAPKKHGETFYEIPDISKIIGAYKSRVATECLKFHKRQAAGKSITPFLGKIWHRSFYGRIITSSLELRNTRDYIRDNPKKWNK